MHSEAPVPVGEVVTVTFDLPDEAGEIAMELEVLVSDGEVEGGLIRGRFHRPHPDAVLRIARWSELQRTAAIRPQNLRSSGPEFIAYIVAIDGVQLVRPLLAGIEDIDPVGISVSLAATVERGMQMRVAVVFAGEPRPDEMDLEVVGTERWGIEEHIAHCRFVNLPESVGAKVRRWAEARATE
jgi:hypothetical protein